MSVMLLHVDGRKAFDNLCRCPLFNNVVRKGLAYITARFLTFMYDTPCLLFNGTALYIHHIVYLAELSKAKYFSPYYIEKRTKLKHFVCRINI